MSLHTGNKVMQINVYMRIIDLRIFYIHTKHDAKPHIKFVQHAKLFKIDLK